MIKRCLYRQLLRKEDSLMPATHKSYQQSSLGDAVLPGPKMLACVPSKNSNLARWQNRRVRNKLSPMRCFLWQSSDLRPKFLVKNQKTQDIAHGHLPALSQLASTPHFCVCFETVFSREAKSRHRTIRPFAKIRISEQNFQRTIRKLKTLPGVIWFQMLCQHYHDLLQLHIW